MRSKIIHRSIDEKIGRRFVEMVNEKLKTLPRQVRSRKHVEAELLEEAISDLMEKHGK